MYFHQKSSILPRTQNEVVASSESFSSPWSIKGVGRKKFVKLLAMFVALHIVFVYNNNPYPEAIQRRTEATSSSGFQQMNSSAPPNLVPPNLIQAPQNDNKDIHSSASTDTVASGKTSSIPRDLPLVNDGTFHGRIPADSQPLDTPAKEMAIDNENTRNSNDLMPATIGDVLIRDLPNKNNVEMVPVKGILSKEDNRKNIISEVDRYSHLPDGGDNDRPREVNEYGNELSPDVTKTQLLYSAREDSREIAVTEEEQKDNDDDVDGNDDDDDYEDDDDDINNEEQNTQENEELVHNFMSQLFKPRTSKAEDDAENDAELPNVVSEQKDHGAPVYDISVLQHPDASTEIGDLSVLSHPINEQVNLGESLRSLNFAETHPEREASSNEDEMPAYSDVDQDQREEQGDEEDRLQPPMPTYPERTPPNREEEVPSFSERDEDRREGQGGEGDRFQPPMPTEKDRSDPFDLRNLNLDPNDLQNMDTETLNKILEANNINPDVLPKFDASGFQAEMRSSTSASGLPSVDSCTKAPWIPAPKRVPIRPTMNASYPGSGARLSWKLIRAITGHMTSDDAVDEGDLAKQGLVISIKTHYPAHGSNDELFKPFASIDRSVLVLRNPVNAIPSFLSYLYERSNGLENHSTRAPPEYWIEWRDKNFESALFSWVEHTLFWLEHNTKGNLLVIAYEHLINKETGPEDLARIGNFLAESSGIELPQTPQAIPCVWDHVVNSRGAEQPQSHRSGGPKHFAYTDRQIEMTITYLSSLKKMYPEIGAIMDEYVVDTLAIQAYGHSNMASQF
eukprot:CAMPEP_0194074574 /NCGR_PEP_ID=MMETSP0149-20130528/1663_1 /TAXON_ID=122233 /ORGANISM="Chaetoceros debilis, Strain MM31A-1" /LENGTH=792 /DNA_ID=CAMNT_0038754789 /DNA_START=351 /DNA_END=2729 /DNA_ORIENTATION=-